MLTFVKKKKNMKMLIQTVTEMHQTKIINLNPLINIIQKVFKGQSSQQIWVKFGALYKVILHFIVRESDT